MPGTPPNGGGANAVEKDLHFAMLGRWKIAARSCSSKTPQPVVILLDLKLPRVSGLEVLRQLKAHPEYCRIPVVVLTTSREDADVAAAYALGVNSYIVKPVEFEKFIDVAAQIDLYWCVLNQRSI
jgi:CheY-like chemotaxis protein